MANLVLTDEKIVNPLNGETLVALMKEVTFDQLVEYQQTYGIEEFPLVVLSPCGSGVYVHRYTCSLVSREDIE